MTPPLQPLHHVSDSGSLSRAGFLLCHICYGKRPCFFPVRQKDRPIHSPFIVCMGTYSILFRLCSSFCRSFTHIATSLIPLKVAAMPLSTKDILSCNIWYNMGPQFKYGTGTTSPSGIRTRDKGSATADSYTTALTTVPLGCLHNNCKLAFNERSIILFSINILVILKRNPQVEYNATQTVCGYYYKELYGTHLFAVPYSTSTNSILIYVQMYKRY